MPNSNSPAPWETATALPNDGPAIMSCCGVAGTLPHPVILSGAKNLNARRTEALREAGDWVASRCFGWAGFQMLRFARMTK